MGGLQGVNTDITHPDSATPNLDIYGKYIATFIHKCCQTSAIFSLFIATDPILEMWRSVLSLTPKPRRKASASFFASAYRSSVRHEVRGFKSASFNPPAPCERPD
jgi:hypothetical protein